MLKRLALLVLLETAWCLSVNQLFTVDQTTCQGIDLDRYFDEAGTLYAAAQTAITNLQNTKSFLPLSNIRNFMRDASNAFGTTYYSPTTLSGLNTKDAGTLASASANIAMAQSLLAGKPPVPGGGPVLNPDNAKIFCSDQPYVVTTDAHDIDPSQPAGTPTQDVFAVPSLLYVPDPGNPNVQRTVVRPDPNNPGRICQGSGADTVIALTQTQRDFTPDEPLVQMILCPPFFDSARFQQSIAVSPPSPEYLGNWRFAAGTIVHEMFHIIGENFNDKRFYVKDDSSNTPRNPYGPETIYALANQADKFQAQYGDIDVLHLPDAYRMFCTMAQFPKTKWSSQPLSGSSKRAVPRNVEGKRQSWRLRRGQ